MKHYRAKRTWVQCYRAWQEVASFTSWLPTAAWPLASTLLVLLISYASECVPPPPLTAQPRRTKSGKVPMMLTSLQPHCQDSRLCSKIHSSTFLLSTLRPLKKENNVGAVFKITWWWSWWGQGFFLCLLSSQLFPIYLFVWQTLLFW